MPIVFHHNNFPNSTSANARNTINANAKQLSNYCDISSLHPSRQVPVGTSSQVLIQTNADMDHIQSLTGYAVESHFRNRKFLGAPEQPVNNLIRYFDFCATQQLPSPLQISLFFVYALADPACQFFLTHFSPTMLFEAIVAQMRLHYNSENRKLQLQSEMNSPNLASFKRKHQIADPATGLTKLAGHINAKAPQLLPGFGSDPPVTRYMRCAVMKTTHIVGHSSSLHFHPVYNRTA